MTTLIHLRKCLVGYLGQEVDQFAAMYDSDETKASDACFWKIVLDVVYIFYSKLFIVQSVKILLVS